MDRARFIVIVDDRIWKSVASDTWTATVLGGLTMLGWWVGSGALQWIGGAMAILWIFGRACLKMGADNKKTISEARRLLDDLEKTK
jgi:hypothetical protein